MLTASDLRASSKERKVKNLKLKRKETKKNSAFLTLKKPCIFKYMYVPFLSLHAVKGYNAT